MTDDLPTYSIAQLEQELADLRFDDIGVVDQSAAYALGTLAAEIIREREVALAVQVVLGDHIVYKAALGGVPQGTTDWLRRKANVTKRDRLPSLLVRLRLEESGRTAEQLGWNDRDFAAYGGSFPILVGGELVGTITTSGAADVVDHEVVVAAVRSYLFN
ncbi:heme-binding protein [Frondihabitans cladoniiphilus]|uniref:Heme-degrading domain-containing protein n=1 Tax=Frondihabitans cladoniiphilus TaxID=715785 RepID=A0ABP8W975_9MICO